MDLNTFLALGSIIIISLAFCSKKKPKQASKSPNPKIKPFPISPIDEKKSNEKVTKSASPAVKVVKSKEKSNKKVKSVKKVKEEKKKESVKKKKEERSKDKKKKRTEKSGDLPIMATQSSTPASQGEEESDSIGTAQIEIIHHTPSPASKERANREKTKTSKENEKKPTRSNEKHEKSPSTGGTTGGTKTAAELRTGTCTAAEIKSTF